MDPTQKGKGSGKHGKDGKHGQDGGKGSTNDGSLLGTFQLTVFKNIPFAFCPNMDQYAPTSLVDQAQVKSCFENNEPRTPGASGVPEPETDHPPPASEHHGSTDGKGSKVLNMFFDSLSFRCFNVVFFSNSDLFSFASLSKVEGLLPLGLYE